jgi:hypothetical protein
MVEREWSGTVLGACTQKPLENGRVTEVFRYKSGTPVYLVLYPEFKNSTCKWHYLLGRGHEVISIN